MAGQALGENPDVLTYVCVLSLLGGVIGARLAYVIQDWNKFMAEPSPLAAMLDITSGGLIYYGGLGLAMISVIVYLAVKRLPIRRYLDILAPSIMLGLAFGRMGCLLNGCCYGGLCDDSKLLAMRFPMYSTPLIKLDGRQNPFSQGTDSPSPVFDAQFRNAGGVKLTIKGGPNEYTAELCPDDFDKDNHQTTSGGWVYRMNLIPSPRETDQNATPKGIDIRWGRRKSAPANDWVPQALVFSRPAWTEDDARKWLSEHPILKPEPLVHVPEELCVSDCVFYREGGDGRFHYDVSNMGPVQLHAPRYLHGKLDKDQLSVMLGTQEDARRLFASIAPLGTLDQQQWQDAVDSAAGPMRGSEFWDEAVTFSSSSVAEVVPGAAKIDFRAFWSYLQARREWLADEFGGGKAELDASGRQKANVYLQQDLVAMAKAQCSLAVRPSQAIAAFGAALLALLLTMGTRLRKREGQVFAAMMVAYPILRFFEEMIRADNPHDLTKLILTHNQYTSMVMLAIGIVMFVAVRRLSPSCGPAWAQRTVAAPMGKGKIDLLLEGA